MESRFTIGDFINDITYIFDLKGEVALINGDNEILHSLTVIIPQLIGNRKKYERVMLFDKNKRMENNVKPTKRIENNDMVINNKEVYDSNKLINKGKRDYGLKKDDTEIKYHVYKTEENIPLNVNNSHHYTNNHGNSNHLINDEDEYHYHGSIDKHTEDIISNNNMISKDVKKENYSKAITTLSVAKNNSDNDIKAVKKNDKNIYAQQNAKDKEELNEFMKKGYGKKSAIDVSNDNNILSLDPLSTSQKDDNQICQEQQSKRYSSEKREFRTNNHPTQEKRSYEDEKSKYFSVLKNIINDDSNNSSYLSPRPLTNISNIIPSLDNFPFSDPMSKVNSIRTQINNSLEGSKKGSIYKVK